MRKLNLIVAVAVVTLSSCWHKDPVLVRRDTYSMMIPEDMTEVTSNLFKNPDASLQYQNLFLEKYIMVINEDISELKDIGLLSNYRPILDDYSEIVLSHMEDVSNGYRSNIQHLKIDGHKAISADLSGSTDGVPIAYKLFFIEGNTDVYQIMIWTSSLQSNSVLPILEKSALSFDEY